MFTGGKYRMINDLTDSPDNKPACPRSNLGCVAGHPTFVSSTTVSIVVSLGSSNRK